MHERQERNGHMVAQYGDNGTTEHQLHDQDHIGLEGRGMSELKEDAIHHKCKEEVTKRWNGTRELAGRS